uniref:cytospin-A n=1 Tax=Myxine glutinosa TaxID=7769 RepID=UPI00358F5522
MRRAAGRGGVSSNNNSNIVVSAFSSSGNKLGLCPAKTFSPPGPATKTLVNPHITNKASRTPTMAALTKSQSRDDLPGGSGVNQPGTSTSGTRKTFQSSTGGADAKAKTSFVTQKRGSVSKDPVLRDKAKERTRQTASRKTTGSITGHETYARRSSRSRHPENPETGTGRSTSRTKSQVDGGGGVAWERAALEARVKGLLALAESKDTEIGMLKDQLCAMQAQLGLRVEPESPGCKDVCDGEHSVVGDVDAAVAVVEGGKSCDVTAALAHLMEQNRAICGELSQLKSENVMLKEQLNALGFSLQHPGLGLGATGAGLAAAAAAVIAAQSASALSEERQGSSGRGPDGDGVVCQPASVGTAVASSREGSSRGSTEDLLNPDGSPLVDAERLSSSVDNLDSETSEFPALAGASSDDALDASSESEGGGGAAGGAQSPCEVSVACLTEKIHQMEESHHSISEELQATLQEFQDLQQVTQELSNENERLSEERVLLVDSLCQQTERADELAQQAEVYYDTLEQHGVPLPDGFDTSPGPRLLEIERRYVELAESARFEREQLLGVQQHLSGALHASELENKEAQDVISNLKDRNRQLERMLESEREAAVTLALQLEEARGAVQAIQVEVCRLRPQLEEERRKVTELCAVYQAGGAPDVAGLLEVASREKELLQEALEHLRVDMEQSHSNNLHLQEDIEKLTLEIQLEMEQHKKAVNAIEQLQEDGKEKETEVGDMKETIFELEDEVEQHRAVKLHDNLVISDLENAVKKLQDQTRDYEKEIKVLKRKLRDESEEWRQFQTDLQTAVVIANEIKAEAQEEIDELKRCLQEAQEKNEQLCKDMEELKAQSWQQEEHGRMINYATVVERDLATLRQGLGLGRRSSLSAEPSPTVKTLIKSFDTASQGSRGQSGTVTARTPLGPTGVKIPPSATVSPMQRHSISGPSVTATKPMASLTDKRPSFGELHIQGVLRRSTEDGSRDCNISDVGQSGSGTNNLTNTTISPKLSLTGASATLSVSPTPRSRLSEERKDPLVALSHEFGGSKRNALLKWCQKKTEGYQNIDITNFSSSWNDGLAFCSLLHTYLPAHIPYAELSNQDKKRNFTLAFQAAESVGIKSTLDINDMVHTERPDWQSVMQYVTAIYKYFET